MKGEIKKHCIPQVIFLQIFEYPGQFSCQGKCGYTCTYTHTIQQLHVYVCTWVTQNQTALEKPFYDVTDTAWLIIYYLLINHQNHHSVQTKFSIQEKESIPLGFKSTGVTL